MCITKRKYYQALDKWVQDYISCMPVQQNNVTITIDLPKLYTRQAMLEKKKNLALYFNPVPFSCQVCHTRWYATISILGSMFCRQQTSYSVLEYKWNLFSLTNNTLNAKL